MKICEKCEKKHDGKYGSGRFCSKTCAKGFSTQAKRSEINQRVSDTMSIKVNGMTKQQKVQKEIADKHASYVRTVELTSLYDISSRTVTKIMKRMNLPCSLCGWHVDGIVCDIHHIVERKNGGTNEHDNLTYICPNCHRLVHNKLISSNDLVSLHDYIGDSWKKYYFVKL
jgi:5-methylcytosine-specific restriction endonuclease McrA